MARPEIVSAVVVGTTMGALVGLGGYTFVYARGASYLTNDAAACANCHVMRGHYDAWLKSSHRSVAACNDCHTPPSIARKYLTKAENGFRHSFAFTTGRFPEPIAITPGDRAVVEEACRACHAPVVGMIEGEAGSEKISCVRCHASVGHAHS